MMQQERHQTSAAGQEWLSALLDGELDDTQAERAACQLVQDPGQIRRWSEYCLIGDALRGDSIIQPGLMQRIHSALAVEPTILAPLPRKRHAARIVRPLVWTAVAAAVAAVTWTVWTVLPPPSAPVQMAAKPEAVMIQVSQLAPYLDAHQDFSQGVVAPPDMAFTRITLVGMEGGR